LEIIRNKLPKLFDRHPNGVTLFVWLGTCDLTEKDEEGFIYGTARGKIQTRWNVKIPQLFMKIIHLKLLKRVSTKLDLHFNLSGLNYLVR
jgi:hypothetical protein